MKSKVALSLIAGMALWKVMPAAAHHSFAAEFDADSPIDLTGVVTKIEWMNPHTFFYVDVENADGSFDNWALEMGSPNGLMRRGWTRNSVPAGIRVNVQGFQARDRSFRANGVEITLPDGSSLFMGSAGAGAPSAE